MPVLRKTVRTRNGIFITKTKCFFYNPENSKRRRSVRMCPMTEGKKKRNKRQSYLKKKYEILNNFDKGDMWVTLTYRADCTPKTPDAAHKNMARVFSCVQRKLKRMGIEFKCYAKTEAGENIRVHHHLLVKNNFPVISVLYDYWKEYWNIRDFKEIYNFSDGRLVTYFLDCEHKELIFEKYYHTRNMIAPEVETRIYPSRSFRENPRPPKPDADGTEYEIRNLKNFFPDRDGYIYQEYEIVKKEVRLE